MPEERLQRFQAENAANPTPIEVIFRLDAGYGAQENPAFLIDMGYPISSNSPMGTSFLVCWLRKARAQKNDTGSALMLLLWSSGLVRIVW